MNDQKKEIPPADLSLKYMAWNVKEVSANFEKLVGLFTQFLDEYKRNNQPKDVRTPV